MVSMSRPPGMDLMWVIPLYWPYKSLPPVIGLGWPEGRNWGMFFSLICFGYSSQGIRFGSWVSSILESERKKNSVLAHFWKKLLQSSIKNFIMFVGVINPTLSSTIPTPRSAPPTSFRHRLSRECRHSSIQKCLLSIWSPVRSKSDDSVQVLELAGRFAGFEQIGLSVCHTAIYLIRL